MPDIPHAVPVAIDYDVACIFCGYNLRGLLPTGRCPECGSPIADSIRGDFLKFADPAWLDKLRLGTSLKLWNILVAILAGLAGGLLAVLTGLSALVPLVAMIAGVLGLWATFLITTQEPRISLQEDPITLRKVIRTCALAAFVGSIIQQGVSAGPGASLGSASVLIAVLGGILGLAGVVAMFGELVYYRRFALRIPDAKLARSTRILLWAIPVTVGAVVLFGVIAVFAGGLVVMKALGPTPPAAPGASILTTSSAGPLTPTVIAPPLSTAPTLALAGIMCVFSCAYIVSFIWYISVLLQYMRAFRDAAAESRAMAGFAAPMPPVPPSS